VNETGSPKIRLAEPHNDHFGVSHGLGGSGTREFLERRLGDQGRYIGNTTDVIDSHERVGGR
jgi:hypothetical protein